MSENPYAPPGSDLGGSSPRDFLPGRGDFDIGRCLSEGWAKTWSNFPLWLVFGLVFVVLVAVAAMTVVGLFLVVPVLTWGGTLFALHMYDGGAEFGDLFAGFSCYGTALVGMLVCMIALALVGLAGQSVQLVGDLREIGWLELVGAAFNLAVTFLISPRLTLSYLYVVDRGMPPVEALKQAWEDTRPVVWKLAVLLLLSSLILIAGFLLLIVGVIPASVISTLMFVSAYRQLVGRPA